MVSNKITSVSNTNLFLSGIDPKDCSYYSHITVPDCLLCVTDVLQMCPKKLTEDVTASTKNNLEYKNILKILNISRI